MPTDSAAEQSWPAVLSSLLGKQDLQLSDTAWVMDQVLSGAASPVQLAAFLIALRAKGETPAEMRGLADGMLAKAITIDVPGTSLDIVGTGGDQAHTVNISTMAAVVAAGAGAHVVKHGNRSASSSSGSADVLEALGLRLDLAPAQVVDVAQQAGITFCFAQTFHPSFRHTATARREMGIPTAFNFLGPLTNPAQPRYSAVGIADAGMAPLMAEVFAERGRTAAVFRGDDGLDELTLSTTSKVWWVRDGVVSEHTVDPPALGLSTAPISALVGGDAAHNAGVVRDLVDGQTGPVRDAVVLNAGIGLALVALEESADRFGAESGLNALLAKGIRRAEESIDSGSARQTLDRWVEVTQTIHSASGSA